MTSPAAVSATAESEAQIHFGTVIRIDSEKGRLYIEGAKASKADNKEEAVPVHSSNVVVVRLDETDKLRMQQLTGNRS